MLILLDKAPEEKELKRLIGKAYPAWKEIEAYLFANYKVETRWADGGKAGIYEYKFRSASRFLCGLYAREGSFVFLVTLGKAERERFEAAKDSFSQSVWDNYEATHTYPDGKWLTIEVYDSGCTEELKQLLTIKKKPRPVSPIKTAPAAKVDYKKKDRQFYLPPTYPEVVDVPPMTYLMVDGTGEPQGESYQQALQILYALSWTIKMSCKSGTELDGYFDYVVPPLEGLWWSPEGELNLSERNQWLWTSMIRQPEFVTQQVFEWAADQCRIKKPGLDLSRVRLESYHEGLCAQMMHIGPYDQEAQSMKQLTAYAQENGYQICTGNVRKHHEIYLSDPRKSAPERMKTVLRIPVEPLM